MHGNLPRRTTEPCAVLVALVALTWSAAPASAQDIDGEIVFLKETIRQAFELTNLPEKSDELDAGIATLLDDRFDTPLIARALLGRYWKRVASEQRDFYVQAFDKYAAQWIGSHIHAINGKDITILRANRRNKREVIVNTRILPEKGAPTLLEWRIRNRKDGSPKIVDVAIEGVSLFSTMRSEFQKITSEQGIEALIARIERTGASGEK